MKALSNDIVIEKIKNVWGETYDLSKVNYINAREKIIIICKKHGEFKIKLQDLLNGHGCKKCAVERIKKKLMKTKEWFIENAIQVHGDKYDYSKVEYNGVSTKVCIICPEHGEFWQTPKDHLNGHGCFACYGKKLKTLNEFISDSRKIHGDKYDYSKVEYKNSKTKVCIICPEHGEFWQTPNAHLNGQGCNLCSKPIHDTKSFINESKKIHGDKYDYSKVDYKRNKSKVCIICPEHGEFWQTPSLHVSQRCGCPLCNMSHLEALTMNHLTKKNIKFKYQCGKETFDWLNMQRLDFYLPDYSIAIECQGIQHFEPIKFFGGEDGLEYRKKLDEKKRHLCEENGIKIIYVFNEFEIDDKINGLQLQKSY